VTAVAERILGQIMAGTTIITVGPLQSWPRRLRNPMFRPRHHLPGRPLTRRRGPLLIVQCQASTMPRQVTRTEECVMLHPRDTMTMWRICTRRTEGARARRTTGMHSLRTGSLRRGIGGTPFRPSPALFRLKHGNSCPRGILRRRGPCRPPRRDAALRRRTDDGPRRSRSASPAGSRQRAGRAPQLRPAPSALPGRSVQAAP
jgi:hypothetical protein